MAKRAKGYLVCSQCSKNQKSEAGTKFCQFCGSAYVEVQVEVARQEALEVQVEVARQEALRDDLEHKWLRATFLFLLAFVFLVSSFLPSLARVLFQQTGYVIFMGTMFVSLHVAHFLAKYVAKKRFPISADNPS